MKEKTLNLLKQNNGLLARLYEHIEEYSEEQLNQQTKAEKWSVMQIMEHLKQTEKLSLSYIQYQISKKSDFKESGLKSKYNSWLLNRLIDSPKKMSAPNIEGLSPEHKMYPLKKNKDEFLTLRKEMFEYFKTLDESLFSKAIYKHPFFGKLNFYQMLNFQHHHIKRHTRQIKGITKLIIKNSDYI